MPIVIAVRFKGAGKSYFFDPADMDIHKGGAVIVETTRGVEIGDVTMDPTDVAESEIVAPLKKVLRIATQEDVEHARQNREKEKEALAICQQKIEQHKLDMKLIDVEYTFDNNKILFYFTSDGRVDFRELVKDLASVFKTRIELRQIGVRDEAKILGGIGICGRCLCCKSFLGDFHPVSIKMAKEQGLSLNPTKISGSCGRLMCCLKYEQDAYEYLLSKTPSVGAIVDTDRGRGVVMSVSLLKGLLKVKLDDGNETDLEDFTVEEVRLIKSPSKRSREKAGAGTGTAAAAGAGAGAGMGMDMGMGMGVDADADMIADAYIDADIDLAVDAEADVDLDAVAVAVAVADADLDVDSIADLDADSIADLIVDADIDPAVELIADAGAGLAADAGMPPIINASVASDSIASASIASAAVASAAYEMPDETDQL